MKSKMKKLQSLLFAALLIFVLSIACLTAIGAGLSKNGAKTAAAADLPTANWQDAGNIAPGFDSESGNGDSASAPYIIKTAGQLAYLAQQVNEGSDYSGKFIALGSDLDLSAHLWTPIGTYTSTTVYKAFSGTFDGGGYKIAGLTINTVDNCQGLFGYVISGTVKNLGIIDCDISGGSRTGGVAGYVLSRGSVINCYNTGAVSGIDYHVGGVAGFVSSSSNVTNCYNTGDVMSSGERTGGVAGYLHNRSTMINCYNTGAVSGTGNHVGGVVGEASSDSTMTSCYNTSAVSGRSYTGGVAGQLDGSSMTNCYNTGAVTGSRYTGGVAGEVSTDGSMTNCYNSGTVTGSDERTGGVVGYFFSGSVTNCYNTGAVTGGSSGNTGGIAGYVGNVNSGGSVTNCYNTGAVTGSSGNTGGVAGYVLNSGSSVTNCYYLTGTAAAAIGVVNGTETTAVFDASGVITSNDGITGITTTENSTTLLDALNAWVADTNNNPTGIYSEWNREVFPILKALIGSGYAEVTMDGFTYNGTSTGNPGIKADKIGDWATVTYEYSDNGVSGWSKTAPVNAGTYYIRALLTSSVSGYYADLTTDSVQYTVSKAANSGPAPAAEIESATKTSITIKAVEGAEYSIDGGATWQDSNVFENLTPGTSYNIAVRIKGTDNILASASDSLEISTEKDGTENDGLSGGAIAGIVIASVVVAGLGGFAIFWFVIKKKKFADLFKRGSR